MISGRRIDGHFLHMYILLGRFSNAFSFRHSRWPSIMRIDNGQYKINSTNCSWYRTLIFPFFLISFRFRFRFLFLCISVSVSFCPSSSFGPCHLLLFLISRIIFFVHVPLVLSFLSIELNTDLVTPLFLKRNNNKALFKWFKERKK